MKMVSIWINMFLIIKWNTQLWIPTFLTHFLGWVAQASLIPAYRSQGLRKSALHRRKTWCHIKLACYIHLASNERIGSGAQAWKRTFTWNHGPRETTLLCCQLGGPLTAPVCCQDISHFIESLFLLSTEVIIPHQKEPAIWATVREQAYSVKKVPFEQLGCGIAQTAGEGSPGQAAHLGGPDMAAQLQ